MDSASSQPKRTAFLLSQLGALASSRFAERTREIGLTPTEAGVLRLVGRSPGLSQRVLADRLGAVPSRVVSLIDSLQARGLVERERSRADRRNHELRLTPEGGEVLRRLREIAEAHEAEFVAPLTGEQSAQLGHLLAQLAGANTLDPDLHGDPGRGDGDGGSIRSTHRP
ncbi:MarR family winged helix-turn-helix transcriptional regulator [Arthrobacter burdickii]|uniref:MarR family transcriptional regulator n=1 Tax=Arthrobacter burdickii TaxID=3035920 RepID=A0ABT8JXY9_9MICC|nr:MarR family transcriptional regulator [Arthrobacter burdickii]MDN4610029.1 MarR family transcriptional regulator [Arthrobacter burdickii]